MEKHTSKKTSEQLKEWGCDLESDKVYINNSEEVEGVGIKEEYLIRDREELENIGFFEYYPIYDLLWDVCVRYSFEFFGENLRKSNKHTEWILRLLQMSEEEKIEGDIERARRYREKAEEYLLSTTIFNPKNK